MEPYAYHASIHHDGSARYVRGPRPGELQLGDEVTIRLRAAPDAPIDRVLLRICPDGEQKFIEMQAQEPDKACCWWEARLAVSMPTTAYRFLIFAQDGVWGYNGAGLQAALTTDAQDFKLLAGYRAPAWVAESVFYQIFPDRFVNGSPENDVRSGETDGRSQPARLRRWDEAPSSTGSEAMVEFYGGDLEGIEQRLDYLLDLGVNALYLNPIFTALSNHRYDVTDYFNVDPHLGGNTALVSLRQACALAGVRLMLDIVPNHCGAAHPWFQAALHDPQAPTAGFFTFFDYPQDYACWLGVRSLPKLNYQSENLRQVMYAGQQSVFRTWLRPPYSIDGWRLDVANMLARQGESQLGYEVAQGIRQAIKEENPAAYMLGENFFDASGQLQGDTYDAGMNYWGFAKPLWYWLTGFYVRQHGQPRHVESEVAWPTQALVDSWQEYRAAIPWVIARQQFNLLGSHDTTRILAMLNGSQALNRLAVAILMTYVGVPSVYYGDEVGIGSDPGDDMRAPMRWNRADWDTDLRQFYKTLIHLRRSSMALKQGGFQVVEARGDVLIYMRDAEEETILVAGNRGSAERPASPLAVAHAGLPDGLVFEELFSGQQTAVQAGWLPLPALPQGVQVWRAVH